jgi:Sigma-70 region 2
MSIEKDREIVARVLAGDKAAFGALIERHHASVLAFSRRILDANEAEDAVQEAFLAAASKRCATLASSEPGSSGSSRTCAATGYAAAEKATSTMSRVGRW